jgi:uroporphyrinogen-III decarboxylase
MSWGGPDPMFDGWDELDREQRRSRRFQRWLEAPGVEFVNDDVRQEYRERVQSLIDAIALKRPARVPVTAWSGFYVAKHSGLTPGEAMRDYAKMAAALVKYHEDFRPDFQASPVAPAGVYELLGLEFVDWPGRGVGDETPWQYKEAEYMKAQEYDALIADPETYFRRSLLPRFGSAFAPLAALNPFSDLMEAAAMPYHILPFGDPAVLEGVQRLADAARESFAWLGATGGAAADASARLGIPPEMGGSVKAPYDVLADTLRGTRGIVMDLMRRPEKLLEATWRLVAPMVALGVRQASRAQAPMIVFWLHKGADGFLSDDHFRTFYWPTLKAVMQGLIAEGIVPMMFVQGSYTRRLEVIADDELPAGSVLWLFDQTDMPAARRALAGRACIGGNVPSALLALGTPAEVEEYVTGLLDACATDGGFFLRSGSALDDARAENLKAMIEVGRAWRG